MENRISVITLILALWCGVPYVAGAYEPHTTHDVLTHEAVVLYNAHARNFGTPVLTDAERGLIQRGAMEEDNDLRMAHHFYDPIHQQGLKGYVSSKSWAEMPTYQGAWLKVGDGCVPQPHLLYPLYESPCDFSWQRAIFDYTYRSRERGLLALGHTLHLIEDASVPDHTRNDAHIPIFDETIKEYDESFTQKSPFEGYVNKYSLEAGNVNTSALLQKEGVVPPRLDTLGAYFDSAAIYSNTNFFSKNTIFSPEYSLPVSQGEQTILLAGGEVEVYETYNSFPLVNVDFARMLSGDSKKVYSLEGDQNYLLESYWQRTSRSAVEHASGVIALFFLEVERERNSGKLLRERDAKVARTATWGVSQIAHLGQSGATLVTTTISGVSRTGFNLASGVTLGVSQIARLGQSGASLVTATISGVSRTGFALATRVTRGVKVLDALWSTDTRPIHMADTPVILPTQIVSVAHPPVIVMHATPTPSSQVSLAELIQRLTEARDVLMRISAPPPLSTQLALAVSNAPSAGEVLGTSTTPEPHALSSLSSLPVDMGVPQGSVPQHTPPDTLPASDERDTTPPSAPRIISHTDLVIMLATTTLHIRGESDVDASLAVWWEHPLETFLSLIAVDDTGEFVLEGELREGTTTLSFLATDEAGNLSPTSTREVVVTLPVRPSISLLSHPREHIEATSSIVELSGTGTPGVLLEVHAEVDGILFSQTAEVSPEGDWHASLQLSSTTTSLFLVARDQFGQVSDPIMRSITIVLPPSPPPSPEWPHAPPSVVISEVAWAGTRANPTHEWIEIHNNTYDPITMDGLFVVNHDRSMSIPLSGVLASDGFYVIARHSETFSNRAPNMVDPLFGDIPDTGMSLSIVYGSPDSTTVVAQVPFCQDWCGKGGDGATILHPWYLDTGVWNYELTETWSERWWLPDNEWSEILDQSGIPIRGTPGASEPVPPFM